MLFKGAVLIFMVICSLGLPQTHSQNAFGRHPWVRFPTAAMTAAHGYYVKNISTSANITMLPKTDNCIIPGIILISRLLELKLLYFTSINH